MIRALTLALAVAGAVAAGAGCGDNSQVCTGAACPDGNTNADARPDASPTNDFTAFVHDQILNHTEPATEDPVPFATFATLDDNDLDDDDYSAYQDLF